MPIYSKLFSSFAALGCIRCSAEFPNSIEIDSRGCPNCISTAPSNLAVRYSKASIAQRVFPPITQQAGLGRFASFLPVSAESMVSLSEGGTALVEVEQLADMIGVGRLYVKDESRNPTWSHKDRYSAVIASHARKVGVDVLATASSGNAGASLAAYAAKAGLPCIVATFEGAAGPMVEQIHRYGAMVVKLKHKEDRWRVLAEGAKRYGWFVTSPFSSPVVGSNPIGIEGYKTIAYEVFEQYGGSPDWFIVPAAYGDVLAGVGRGFADLQALGLIKAVPRLVAAEIHGSLSQTLRENADAIRRAQPKFTSRAVSIGVTQSTFQALHAIRSSEGCAVTLNDDEVSRAQARLASSEGLFCELSSAIAVAAAKKLRQSGVISANDTVICLMTASGLKDIDHLPGDRSQARALEGNMRDILDFLHGTYGFHPQENPHREQHHSV